MGVVKNKIGGLLNTGKLAKKISAAVGTLVIVSMAIMVLVSTLLSRSYLQKSINGEFSGLAEKNSVIVQNVLNEAILTASDLQAQIEDMYEEWGANWIQWAY